MTAKNCPKGHELPNPGCSAIYCREDQGAEEVPRRRTVKQNRDAQDAAKIQSRAEASLELARLSADPAVMDSVMPAIEGDQAQKAAREHGAIAQVEERVALGQAVARHIAREVLVPTPRGLSGQDAETYADRKITDLLPHAVSEIEHQLKFGDRDERWKAAVQVLKSTGRESKQNAGPSTAPITIIMGGSQPARTDSSPTPAGSSAAAPPVLPTGPTMPLALPWAKRLDSGSSVSPSTTSRGGASTPLPPSTGAPEPSFEHQEELDTTTVLGEVEAALR